MVLESLGTLLAVLTPLCAVPMTLIVFYLRGLRENQQAWQAESVRRIDAMEGAFGELRRAVESFERDYATKEEWLRECMHARRMLEQLSETAARLDVVCGAACGRPGKDCE